MKAGMGFKGEAGEKVRWKVMRDSCGNAVTCSCAQRPRSITCFSRSALITHNLRLTWTLRVGISLLHIRVIFLPQQLGLHRVTVICQVSSKAMAFSERRAPELGRRDVVRYQVQASLVRARTFARLVSVCSS
jgi:hypothetical protein